MASKNTATGSHALFSNTIGNNNTATGFAALFKNTADNNTATGANALLNNTTGTQNTATGVLALWQNTDHSYNTAIGFGALALADADGNTATGNLALHSDLIGYDNTATGVSALFSNETGYYNVASGVGALANNLNGHDNTAVGFLALLNNKGSSNIGLGSNAGANLTTGNNNIDIGANVLGPAGDANTIRIGKQGTQKSTFVAGIFGTAVSGNTVVVNSNGKLWVATSSARFKEAIKPMDKASEAILALKPVTFRYKEEIDPNGVPQFGLIAEEVEKIDANLITSDGNGKPLTVRYEAINAMLLNEFLKEHRKAAEEHRKVEEQGRAIQELRGLVTKQQKQIENLTAGLQRVSDEVELAKPVSKLIANN